MTGHLRFLPESVGFLPGQKTALILAATFIFGLNVSRAHAQAKVELTESLGQNRSTLGWSAVQKWEWATNEENVRTLTSKVVVDLPSNDFTAVKSARETTKSKIVGGKLNLSLAAMTEKFAISGGSEKKVFSLALKLGQGSIIDENCSKSLVSLRSQSKTFPFYIGISCGGREGKDLTTTLTFPADIELEQSTIFEAKGKGEPWRHFELGNVKAASGEIARFTFKYRGKPYAFALESLRNESRKEKSPPAGRIGIGLNFASMKIDGSDISAASSKPGVSLRVPSYPVLGALGFGLDFDTSVAMGDTSSDPQAITYLQLQAFASYEFTIGKIRASPRAYFVVTDSQNPATRVGLKQSQLAGGGHLVYPLSDRLELSLETFIASFGSKVVKSHYFLDVFAVWKRLTDTGMSYGAGLKMQSYSTEGKEGATRKFDQMIVYGMVLF